MCTVVVCVFRLYVSVGDTYIVNGGHKQKLELMCRNTLIKGHMGTIEIAIYTSFGG